MSLIKWEPLNDIEALMDRALTMPSMPLASTMPWNEWGPRVDIYEANGTYQFKADLPGMRRDDVSVTVSGDRLTVQGERKREKEEKNPRFHRVERSYGSFSRSFTLPDDADLKAVKAHCENGELTISIPRQGGAVETKAVKIPVS